MRNNSKNPLYKVGQSDTTRLSEIHSNITLLHEKTIRKIIAGLLKWRAYLNLNQILYRVVTVDKRWIHYQKSKQQAIVETVNSRMPSQKITTGPFITIHINYGQIDKTIDIKYYANTRVQSKAELRRKTTPLGPEERALEPRHFEVANVSSHRDKLL